MIICKTKKEIQNVLADFRNDKIKIGFVPTMGALHSGHLSLIKRSVSENDIVVVSVFVNPTQFNNKDDLNNYPRDFEEDASILSKSGCTIAFFPSEKEVYENGDLSERIDFEDKFLFNTLEGEFRPGHFSGVVTVVKKLFEIISPQKAYFGKKDYQQLAIIKKMVDYYKLPIEINACEIIREKNGLALSSRNLLLTYEEKEKASNIHKTLEEVKKALKNDFSLENIKKIKDQAISHLNSFNNFKVDYLEIVNADNLQKIESNFSGKALICTAVYVGNVRLIDNSEVVL